MKEITREKPYVSEKRYYYRLYLFFVENKFVPYNTFMKKLKMMFNINNLYPSILYRKIEHMKTYISYELAEEMKLILDYIIVAKNNDREKIFDLYPKIKNIDSNNHIRKQEEPKSKVYTFKTPKSTIEKSNNVREKLIIDLNLFISQNKYISEYSEEDRKKIEKLCQRIRNNINGVESEDYIKFIKLYKNLNPISCAELDQYLEVLEYFCKYLDENVLKFIQLETEEQIRSFYVSGEENLSDSFKENITTFRRWKLYKIRAHQEHYHKLKDLMYTFKENLNLEDLYELDGTCKQKIKEDMPCIYEFYADIMELSRKYREICELNKVSYGKREKMKEEFKKQMVLRNN